MIIPITDILYRYVRTNRKRLKGELVKDVDCKLALETLFSVLYTMVRVFAPFTPFLTEQMYQMLKLLVKVSKYLVCSMI